MNWRLLALAEQLDDGLLRQVFTHSSWVAERGRSYERLEFLGDSVLSLAVTTELYRRFPDHSEGSLARLRAYIVSRATCAKVATRLGLPEFVRRFGTGHETVELDQLVANENILADMTESLIGAVYLTYGLDVVRPAVIEAFTEHISFAERSYVDFKTELQEQLAKNGRSVVYQLVETVGPPHSREFVLEAVVDGVALGRGVGASKKRAEQDAAAEALRELSGAERPKRRRARGRRRGAGTDADLPAGGDAALYADDDLGDRAEASDETQTDRHAGPEPESGAVAEPSHDAKASSAPADAPPSDTLPPGTEPETAPVDAEPETTPVDAEPKTTRVDAAPLVPESAPAVKDDAPAPVADVAPVVEQELQTSVPESARVAEPETTPVDAAPLAPENAPVVEPETTPVDAAPLVPESAPVVEPEIPARLTESAPAVEADNPAPVPEMAPAVEADASALLPAVPPAHAETTATQTDAQPSVETPAAAEPASRVGFDIGAATRGQTVLRSYSVEVSADTDVAKPAEPVAKPDDEPAGSGDPVDADGPHGTNAPADGDDVGPAADQGAQPPHADGGV
jgi:ribonuclease III